MCRFVGIITYIRSFSSLSIRPRIELYFVFALIENSTRSEPFILARLIAKKLIIYSYFFRSNTTRANVVRFNQTRAPSLNLDSIHVFAMRVYLLETSNRRTTPIVFPTSCCSSLEFRSSRFTRRRVDQLLIMNKFYRVINKERTHETYNFFSKKSFAILPASRLTCR